MLAAGRCLFVWPAVIFPVVIVTRRSHFYRLPPHALKHSREKEAFGKYQTLCHLSRMVEVVNNLCRSPHHSVSVTGGEPLLYPSAVRALTAVRQTGAKIFLETNGTLPAALDSVLDAIDIISMDVKLPSAMHGKQFWNEHACFLRIAAQREVYVKVVLTGDSTDAEFCRAVDMVAAINRDIPVVLQPVTPIHGISAVSSDKILRWQAAALTKLSAVRVIPQMHKLLGVL